MLHGDAGNPYGQNPQASDISSCVGSSAMIRYNRSSCPKMSNASPVRHTGFLSTRAMKQQGPSQTFTVECCVCFCLLVCLIVVSFFDPKKIEQLEIVLGMESNCQKKAKRQ